MHSGRRNRAVFLLSGSTLVVLVVLVGLGAAGFDLARPPGPAHLVMIAPPVSQLAEAEAMAAAQIRAPSEPSAPIEPPLGPFIIQPRIETPPQYAVPLALGYLGPAAVNPPQAVANSYAAGSARASRVAVAVLDRNTGGFFGAGDVDASYASASVMKVFIATRLLAEGRAGDQNIQNAMWRMIVYSDNDAASYLYNLTGRESLIPWIANRYQLGGLAPANMPGYWGLTRITARAMVYFYARVANDPAVAPWLLSAMGNAQQNAGGFNQYFGIPSAAQQWRVKQGWMCCLENLTRMHSTGFVGGDRYTVALLTEGSRGIYGSYGAQTVTLMAQALMPGGTIPQWTIFAPPTVPSPSPSESPSPSDPPSPSESPEPAPTPSL